MPRSFFMSSTLGFIVGVVSAPLIYDHINEKSQFPLNDILYGAIQPRNVNQWPSSQEAMSALFEYQKWDRSALSSDDIAKVDECVSLENNTFGCDITLKLSWLDKDAAVSATLKRDTDTWQIVRIQKNLP